MALFKGQYQEKACPLSPQKVASGTKNYRKLAWNFSASPETCKEKFPKIFVSLDINPVSLQFASPGPLVNFLKPEIICSKTRI